MMVVGAPGTGKGSQCERLRKDFGFDYISTAELLKTEISERRIYSELIE
jgi:adenylate kinase family enzyme